MKDAYYFSHDYNAQNDPNIVKLLFKHGWSGYGLYWAIIEKLRNEPEYIMDTDYDMIAYALRTNSDLIESIIGDFNLFVIEKECFHSPSLKRRMGRLDEIKEKRVYAGKMSGISRNKAKPKQPLNKKGTSVEQVLNSIVKHSTVKNSTVKNSTVNKNTTLSEIETVVDEFYTFQKTLHPNKYLNFNKQKECLYRDSVSIIDKLIQIDGYTFDQIKGALTYAVKDDFWSINTLSLSGLRKKSQNGLMKFENLFAKYEQGDKGLKYERFSNG